MDALGLVLCIGATFRLWRLWHVDEITEGLRARVEKLIGEREWLWKLIYCPWCLGFYLSAMVVGTYLAWGSTWPWLFAAGTLTVNAAFAYAYGLVEVEDE